MKLLPLVALTLLAAASLRAEEKALFNGKDLSGWKGVPELWSVQDGAITGKTTKEVPAKENNFLIWQDGEVGDFELTFKFKMIPGDEKGFANSGVQYRSKIVKPEYFVVAGYQADMEAGKTYSGILYEEKGRGMLAKRGEKTVISPVEKDAADPKSKDFKVEVTGSVGNSDEIQASIKQGEWNDYKIIAKGNHLQHFINGHQTIDATDNDEKHAAKTGVLALQLHAGPPMQVQFKDLVLKTEK